MEKIMKLIFLMIFLINVPISLVQGNDKDYSSDIKLSTEGKLLVSIENVRCNQTSDCVVVEEVCGKGWRPINKKYEEAAKKIVSEGNSVIDCLFSNFLKPRLACISGACEIISDRDKCMLRDASGECITKCNILAKDGKCQHTCTKGLPCD